MLLWKNYILKEMLVMKKENKKLLEEVIKDRLTKSLGNDPDEASEALKEAMEEASDAIGNGDYTIASTEALGTLMEEAVLLMEDGTKEEIIKLFILSLINNDSFVLLNPYFSSITIIFT